MGRVVEGGDEVINRVELGDEKVGVGMGSSRYKMIGDKSGHRGGGRRGG